MRVTTSKMKVMLSEKRDEIAKTLQEKKDEFQKKYKDKWEQVLLAEATKQAKESLVESFETDREKARFEKLFVAEKAAMVVEGFDPFSSLIDGVQYAEMPDVNLPKTEPEGNGSTASGKSSEEQEESPKQKVMESFQTALAEQATYKLSLGDDLKSLFEAQELDETFAKQAVEIFESAVSVATKKHLEMLSEKAGVVFEGIVEDQLDVLDEQVAKLVEKTVSEWKEENKLAIKTHQKHEIAESFMEGLKELMSEHWIEIPEEKLDLYQAEVEKSKGIQESLDKAIEKTALLEKELKETKKALVVESFVKDLVLTQAEKVKELAEGLEFVDEESFKQKLTIFKESTSKAKQETTEISESVVDEKVKEKSVVSLYAAKLKKS